MQATSQSQFASAESDPDADGATPGLELVRPGLYALGVPMPGILPHYTLCYLVVDARNVVHIIDPGWDSEANWNSLLAGIETIGGSASQIASVTVTHLHPDHLGMAERVRAQTGATVAIHHAEQPAIYELAAPAVIENWVTRFANWGVPTGQHRELLDAVARRNSWPTFTADQLLDDGDRLEIPGWELRILHTPGHTTGHVAIQDSQQRLLFTGDLLLPSQFPGVGLGGNSQTNPLEDYLSSLDRVSAFDDHEVLPGHGYRFLGLAERCAQTVKHHEHRSREVASIQSTSKEQTVWQIAGKLTWTAGWANLHGLQLLSALSQTALHVRRSSAG